MRVLPGLHADGTEKVRPIDNMSASLINAATEPTEKLRHVCLRAAGLGCVRICQMCECFARCDTLDSLWESAKTMHHKTKTSLGFFKVDVDAAYRCEFGGMYLRVH